MILDIRPPLRRSFELSLVFSALLLPGTLHAANGGVDREKKEISIEARPSAEEALERFTTNLTEIANSGKLPPFVGERQQIRNILEVINKGGTKVIYVLGAAGSGKTAMVEHTAGQLPGKTLYRLNMNALEAGTGYRGMLEDRLEALLEAFAGHPDRILFVDEAHVAMRVPDFMDKLKPAMARGELNVVFATTRDEYREFIEKDAALTSRASVYFVEDPTEAKLLAVLRANRENLEKQHGLTILDAALVMTARLTMRYFSNEPVLRKALDIIDRAASRKVLNQKLGNYDLLALEDRMEALELHKKSLLRDRQLFPDSQEMAMDLLNVADEMAAVEDKMREMEAREDEGSLQLQLGELMTQMQQLQRSGDFLGAAKIQNEDIPDLKKRIAASGAVVRGAGQVMNVLGELEIVHFFGRETRIPEKLLAMKDAEKLEHMADTMAEKVIGQPEAIAAVVGKVKIRMEGVEAITGPQAVIMMDGPTGVGKSEMMKSIALSMFGDSKRLIRVNMNGFGPHSQSQLFGSGFGIRDSEKGGMLDEIRRTPYVVVGFDEFDKAPRDIWMSLLQILDEGVVDDARGRKLDFRNAVIVMQSNFTAEYAIMKDTWTDEEIEKRFAMAPGSLRGLEGRDRDVAVLDAAMAMRGVPPEVRNRIGVKLIFNALSPSNAAEIAMKNLNEQAAHLWAEKRILVYFDSTVAVALARAAYDPMYGARPILQKRSEVISDLLADMHLQRGQKVMVKFVENSEATGGELVATVDEKEFAPRPLAYKKMMQGHVDDEVAAAADEAGTATSESAGQTEAASPIPAANSAPEAPCEVALLTDGNGVERGPIQNMSPTDNASDANTEPVIEPKDR